MLVYPNCKINLGLNVIARRTDGYHDLETVFYPVPFCDILEIVPARDGQTRFTASGLEIPGDPEDNLCMKAYRRMADSCRLPAVKIHLHKVIPTGAGLGGGSSDGAFTIRLLNQLFDLGLPDHEMESLAGAIGSDCPFFIRNEPVFATGRGEIFESAELSLKGFRLLLVIPPVAVATADAYAGIVPAVPDQPLKKLIRLPAWEWKGIVSNDFEPIVFRRFPLIGQIRDALYDAGALYASMTGSGSALFGLFAGDVTPALEWPGASVHYFQL